MSAADAMHVANAFNLFICSCCVAIYINNEVCLHGTVMFTYNVIDNYKCHASVTHTILYDSSPLI